MLQSVATALGLAGGSAAAGEDRPLTREELDSCYDFAEVIGHDARLLRVLQMAGRVAGTDASVLLCGESGTGKELVAEAIHRNSRRRDGPFVKVNLGGIPSTLFESEMFGHVRGAFTDARADRKGRFEVAHGGTIFLDEIGDLDAGSQVKLLRVLQDRAYEALGSSQTRVVDIRVISATNRSLSDLVDRGEFREDLLYRINLITLRLPPLRERPDDIPVLAGRFVRAVAHTYGRDDLALGPAAAAWLRRQPWPGNVRQLRQWIERAALVGPHDTLDVTDFEAVARMEPRDAARDALPPVGSMTMDEIERAMIVKSLKHHGGNITRVAESLGLSRAALYRRLEKYGIPA
jgi:transcriptional regulator with PAS, ATPase and Fis domain